MMLEPTVRSRFRVRSSALCVPTFETKKELMAGHEVVRDG